MRRANAAGVKLLYHYEPLNEGYLSETLANNRVHLSSPSHFNDPWDCSPLYSAAGLEDESCRMAWTRFFTPIVSTLPAVNRQAVEEGARLHDPRFLTMTIGNLSRHSREITLQMWRIYCLTPHPDRC
jgi:hypothetical protein